MKKTIVITIALLAFIVSANAQQKTPVVQHQEKTYTLTENQVNILFDFLRSAQKALPNSSVISAVEATNALMSIDSLQKVFIKQYKLFAKQDSIIARAKLDEVKKTTEKTDAEAKKVFPAPATKKK